MSDALNCGHEETCGPRRCRNFGWPMNSPNQEQITYHIVRDSQLSRLKDEPTLPVPMMILRHLQWTSTGKHAHASARAWCQRNPASSFPLEANSWQTESRPQEIDLQPQFPKQVSNLPNSCFSWVCVNPKLCLFPTKTS